MLNLVSNPRYSSLKVFLLWCSFWFIMYTITLSNCEWLYENAPKPDCHWNFKGQNLFSLIKSLLDFLTSLTKFDKQQVGFIPIRKCRWLGIPFIASIFCSLFWTMPVMYLYNCSSKEWFINEFLPLQQKLYVCKFVCKNQPLFLIFVFLQRTQRVHTFIDMRLLLCSTPPGSYVVSIFFCYKCLMPLASVYWLPSIILYSSTVSILNMAILTGWLGLLMWN